MLSLTETHTTHTEWSTLKPVINGETEAEKKVRLSAMVLGARPQDSSRNCSLERGTNRPDLKQRTGVASVARCARLMVQVLKKEAGLDG